MAFVAMATCFCRLALIATMSNFQTDKTSAFSLKNFLSFCRVDDFLAGPRVMKFSQYAQRMVNFSPSCGPWLDRKVQDEGVPGGVSYRPLFGGGDLQFE